MATKPVPPPVPELVSAVSVRSHKSKIVIWGSPQRTIVLLLLLLVVAYAADYFDDSDLQVAHPIAMSIPQGGRAGWSSLSASALAGLHTATSPDSDADSDQDSDASSLGLPGSSQSYKTNGVRGRGLLLAPGSTKRGAASQSAVDAAFGSPY